MDRCMALGEPCRTERAMKRFLKSFTSDRIFAILLLLDSCGAFPASLLLMLSGADRNATVFPLVVSSAFLLFAVLNVIFAFRRASDAPRGSLSSVLWVCALLLGLCAGLLLHVPFWILCPVFLFAASFVVLKQKWLPSLLSAAITTGLIYLVFAVLFRVPLP